MQAVTVSLHQDAARKPIAMIAALSPRHCEHRHGAKRRPVSEAIHLSPRASVDCFVARAPRNDGVRAEGRNDEIS